ncbi:YfcE family phosphodiesterase [Campylobacter sp. faydin G-24]|uniref:Phosphoesterase n=1 Tax=Campylobacter anatolicus TaxID=2829105 RepID=A0ABS5HGC3_9BACT|nr:YfcE family phosphodiesterase [Campylobacter anatolicus]
MQEQKRNLKIGIISDSHHRTDVAKDAIDLLVKNGCELVLHAGDILKSECLKYLQDSGVAYRAVIGNNDSHLSVLKVKFDLFDEPYEFKFKELDIRLMHHSKFINTKKNNVNLVVFGHTHSFTTLLQNDCLIINPGEICGRNFGVFTFAMVEFDGKNFNVYKFSKTPQSTEFKVENINLQGQR